jgi:hypothetical protein
MHSALQQHSSTHWPSQVARHHQASLSILRQPGASTAPQKHNSFRPVTPSQQEAFSSSSSNSRAQQHVLQESSSIGQQVSYYKQPGSSARSRVQCQASTQFTPMLSASEISRGLTNMDLHLR